MTRHPLHYENIGGMLVRTEDGLLRWLCPSCGARGSVKRYRETCPDCGHDKPYPELSR